MERSRIADFFINIRIISFLRNSFRVTPFEIFVKKRDVAYDAKSVSDNTEFMSVTKMPVDTRQFNCEQFVDYLVRGLPVVGVAVPCDP